MDIIFQPTKSLILSLPQTKDRVLASAWYQRLSKGSEPEDVKITYFILLQYFLQKRKLGGVFLTHPDQVPQLPEIQLKPIPPDSSNRQSKHYPFSSDFSQDLTSYIAYQNIDKFGVQCYYALSPEPIQYWNKFNDKMLPSKETKRREVVLSSTAKNEAPEKKAEEEKTEKKNNVPRQESLERVPPSWGSNLIAFPRQTLKDE